MKEEVYRKDRFVKESILKIPPFDEQGKGGKSLRICCEMLQFLLTSLHSALE